MPTLRALELCKHYKKKAVVQNFSMHINNGEIVGLLGPNGAGKTTSFYMLVGLIACDKGQIFFDDKNITQLPMHIRARCGMSYLPQEASVFRKLTVEQNIMAILQLRRELTDSQRKDILEHLLNEFHIQHIRHNISYSLSGGERRRVEIARALSTDPQFILLDEPFAGVDPISVLDIKRIITHLKERGIGVLITDHNVRETLDICQRAYILNDGLLLCEGSPQTIMANQRVREVYLGTEFNL